MDDYNIIRNEIKRLHEVCRIKNRIMADIANELKILKNSTNKKIFCSKIDALIDELNKNSY